MLLHTRAKQPALYIRDLQDIAMLSTRLSMQSHLQVFQIYSSAKKPIMFRKSVLVLSRLNTVCYGIRQLDSSGHLNGQKTP